ncbi:MAG: PRC-barrel domain-containing protein, partial [Anaerolineae bacterium]
VEFLEDLPPFRETEYVPAGIETAQTREQAEGTQDKSKYPTQMATGYFWYPPAGMGWWRGIGSPTYVEPEWVRTVEYNIPEGTVALEEGGAVISSDDEHIGKIEKILTDTQEHRATHLVISKGLLLKERKLIPTQWMRTVLQDKVYLSVSSDLIEDLPEYKSPPE